MRPTCRVVACGVIADSLYAVRALEVLRLFYVYYRGMGMLVGVEIVTDKESRKPNKDAAELLVYKYVLKHYRTDYF